MTEQAFASLADSLLESLEEAIGADGDAELQGGVLTVQGEAGTWLVNKHAPTRQIWLSSPKSGARHYAFEAASGLWQDTRGGGRPAVDPVGRAGRRVGMAPGMNRFAGLALLGPYLRPYRGRVTLALLSLLVAAGTVLAFGACLRALIDRGFAQGRPDVLNYALASLLAVALVLAIASGTRFYLVSWLGERVVGDLRRDLFAHVVRLGPAWFEIKRSGDVMSRISSDAQLIEQVIGSSASVALRNTLMCVGGIVMLVVTNPKLALWVLALVPIVVAPIIIFGRKVRKLSREAQARVADMVSEGGETLDAVRTVQAFAQEEPRRRSASPQATERAFDAAIARTGQRGRDDHAGDLHRLRRRRLPAVDGRAGRDRGRHLGRRPLGLRVLCRAGGDARAARSARRSATCSAPRVRPSGWPSCAPSSR